MIMVGHIEASRIMAYKLKEQADILQGYANVEPDAGKAMIAATAGCVLNSMAHAYGNAVDEMEKINRGIWS